MFIELVKEWKGKPAGEKIDVSQEHAELLVSTGTAKAVQGDPLGDLMTDYIQKATGKMTATLDQAIDAGLKSFLDSQANKSPKPPMPLDPGEDPKAGFKHLGEFAHAVKAASRPGTKPDDRLLVIQQKAVTGLGETHASDGGFLVPAEFSKRIFERVFHTEKLLGRTDSYNVSGNGMAFPRNNESSRASTRRGGVLGYWLDEGAQLTGSKPTFGRLQLTLHKLAVLIYATDELLSDSSVALDRYLEKSAEEEIDFLLGDAIINGAGAGKPLGILNAPCTVSVAKETGQAAASIYTENIVKMWARLFAPCRDKAVWLINQDVEPQLHTMTLGVGGSVTYLPPGGLSGKPYATLMGRPIVPVEWCPTLGSVGDIILADLSQYVTISKGMIDSAVSMHLRFDYDEMAFRFIFRVDGAPWWATALTPFKGSNTQSPFVTLATRS